MGFLNNILRRHGAAGNSKLAKIMHTAPVASSTARAEHRSSIDGRPSLSSSKTSSDNNSMDTEGGGMLMGPSMSGMRPTVTAAANAAAAALGAGACRRPIDTRPGRGLSSDGGCPRPPPGAPAARSRRRSTCSGTSGGLDALFSDVALIHRGRNALIHRARERQGRRPVVLKSYDLKDCAALEREVRLLRDVGHHPGVVRLEAVLETSQATHLVLEACGGGTLIEAIANSGGRLAERVAARRIAVPLLKALAHLHAKGIVHRDIKPEHILLTQDGLRIADFTAGAYLPSRQRELAGAAGCEGAGRQRRVSSHGMREELLNSRLLTMAIEYMAPEVLSKPTATEVFHLVLAHGMAEEDLPVYGEKADIWSVGAVLFEAVTGCQPFLADGAAEMAAVVAQRLATRDPDSGLPSFLARQPGLSADCKDFIARCLEDNPAARPSAADLLNHPWLARRASVADERPAAAGGGQHSNAPAAGKCQAPQVTEVHAFGGTINNEAVFTWASPTVKEPIAVPAIQAPFLHMPFTAPGDGRACSSAGALGRASPAVEALALHRCLTDADVPPGLHLTTRSNTGRLEGSFPGTRAVAAAQLVPRGEGD